MIHVNRGGWKLVIIVSYSNDVIMLVAYCHTSSMAPACQYRTLQRAILQCGTIPECEVVNCFILRKKI